MIVINGLPKAYANLGETMAFAAMQHVDALEPGRHEWKTWVTQGLLSFKLNGIRYVVPEGFMTDFSSVPRVFRWLFSPSGEPHQSAGLIHDVLVLEHACDPQGCRPSVPCCCSYDGPFRCRFTADVYGAACWRVSCVAC